MSLKTLIFVYFCVICFFEDPIECRFADLAMLCHIGNTEICAGVHIVKGDFRDVVIMLGFLLHAVQHFT